MSEPSSCYPQITEDKSGDLSRGTRITLFLKEDAKELSDEKKLGELIKQYSEFIQFPIRLWQSNVKTEEVIHQSLLMFSRFPSFASGHC